MSSFVCRKKVLLLLGVLIISVSMLSCILVQNSAVVTIENGLGYEQMIRVNGESKFVGNGSTETWTVKWLGSSSIMVDVAWVGGSQSITLKNGEKLPLLLE